MTTQLLHNQRRWSGVALTDPAAGFHVAAINAHDLYLVDRNVHFSNLRTVSEMAGIDCLICLCPYTSEGDHVPLALRCGHSFGKSCLQAYMSTSRGISSCPQCRSVIGGPFESIRPNYPLISCLESLKHAHDVRTAGCNTSTFNCTAVEPRTAECSPNEGRSLVSLASELGINVSELRTAGWSASDLTTGGCTATQLTLGGFTVRQLKAAGYTAHEVGMAGNTTTQMKAAGYTINDLEAAGYTVSELKTAGYTAGQMKVAGYTASELMAVGYTASKLRRAGYICNQISGLHSK